MNDPHPLAPGGVLSPTFLVAVREAVAELDVRRADRLALALAAEIHRHEVPPEGLSAVFDPLRQLRRFKALRDLCEAVLDAHPGHARARRHYAQTLIELGSLQAASDVLHRALEDPNLGDERNEVLGLIGRVTKQAYVDGGPPSLERQQERLRQSIRVYHEVYGRDPSHYWHGINAVALLYRARLDNISTAGLPALESLAGDVLGQALSDPASYWSLATAMEASVGLGDLEGALQYAQRAVAHAETEGSESGAFHIASTLRQLTEVWDLDRDDGGLRQEIVDLMASALLQQEHGAFELSAKEVVEGAHPPDEQDRHAQRVLGNTGYLPIAWYREGLAVAQAVAQVGNRLTSIGTGFLIAPSALGYSEDEGPLFVTNNHVLSEDGHALDSLHPDDAVVTFHAAGDAPFETGIARVVWQSPPRPGLDVTVTTLRSVPPEVRPLQASRNRPDLHGGFRLYAVGHPCGKGIAFSLQDNHVIDRDDDLIHYRTPTDPGSSGSPVLNGTWDVVGIHRRGGDIQTLDGSGYHAANEGVFVHSVRRDIEATRT